MSLICASLGEKTAYKDRKYQGSDEDWKNDLNNSTTLYVGNLSFFTTEEQIYELFSKSGGDLKRIIMGLDRNNKTPCGFCFVEYYNRTDAIDAVKYISGTKLDDRVIRADIDPGFKDGRQYGRGRSGGQVRDEIREEFDAGRGGWGAQVRLDRENISRNTYESSHAVPMGASSNSTRDNEYERNSKRRNDEGEDDDVDEFGRSRAVKIKNSRLRERDEDDEDE